jgi:hypothetical protein
VSLRPPKPNPSPLAWVGSSLSLFPSLISPPTQNQLKLKDETITKARKLAESDKLIRELLVFYDYITKNSAYESYISRRITLERWDQDLIEHPVSLFTAEDASEDEAKARDKEVDRVLKYLEKQLALFDQTQEFYQRLFPVEKEATNKDKRLSKADGGRAFVPLSVVEQEEQTDGQAEV